MSISRCICPCRSSFFSKNAKNVKRRAQAQTSVPPSSSSLTCGHWLLCVVPWPKDLLIFDFICILLELFNVKPKPFSAAWHDILPCSHEYSCISYKTTLYHILFNKKANLCLSHLPRYPFWFFFGRNIIFTPMAWLAISGQYMYYDMVF